MPVPGWCFFAFGTESARLAGEQVLRGSCNGDSPATVFDALLVDPDRVDTLVAFAEPIPATRSPVPPDHPVTTARGFLAGRRDPLRAP